MFKIFHDVRIGDVGMLAVGNHLAHGEHALRRIFIKIPYFVYVRTAHGEQSVALVEHLLGERLRPVRAYVYADPHKGGHGIRARRHSVHRGSPGGDYFEPAYGGGLGARLYRVFQERLANRGTAYIARAEEYYFVFHL